MPLEILHLKSKEKKSFKSKNIITN